MGTPLTLSSVPAATPYIQYVATGGQTVFPYPFPITQDSDLIVVVNGVTQATDSGYTLSGQGNPTGGNLTFTSGRTGGDVITLFRDITIERLTQFGQNSGFSSTAFNAEFNNVYLILQQLVASIAQSLQIPNTNNPAPTTTLLPANYANKYLSFDSYGNPTPADLTSSGALTQAIIGALFYPTLSGETGVVSKQYFYGNARRYGAALNATWSGSAGSGTDDTVAFTNAVASVAALGGGEVTFDGSTIVKNVPLASGVSIRGLGNPTVYVNPLAATDCAFTATGVIGSYTAFGSNVAPGADVIPVASTSSFSPGQLVVVNTNEYVFGGTNGRKQEISRVASLVTNTSLTLETGLLESYATANSAQVAPLSTAIENITLRGFKIQDATGSNGGGLSFTLCANLRLEDLVISGASGTNAPSVWLSQCAFVEIKGCTMRDHQQIAAGASTGIAVNLQESCHDIDIHDCLFQYFTQNLVGFRCRYVNFHHNRCRYAADNAINTHGVGVSHVLITDNEISDSAQYGIAVGQSSSRAGDSYVTVARNLITNTQFSAILSQSSQTNTFVTIAENRIVSPCIASASAYCLQLSNTNDLDVVDNQIDGTTITNAPAGGTLLSSCTGVVYRGNRVRNISSGYGVRLTSCANFQVSDNYFANVSSYKVFTASSTAPAAVYNNESDVNSLNLDASTSAFGNVWAANPSGSITLGAAASTVVNNACVTATCKIILTPTNAAAATLMGSTKSLYVSARSAATSFTVHTADGTNAAGTETFDYLISA